MSALQPNTLFCDYRIQRKIGEGGFAEVYLAAGVSGPVALKVLKRPSDGYDRATKVRFDREVRILRNLRSDHVVELIDAGTSPDGLLYAVFEYVEGEDLAEYLQRSGPLRPDDVQSILRQCLRGLAEAHRRGLVHRDIKPQNIRLVGGTGHVKLLDFGIARDSSPEDSVTKTGELIGTLRYMSPEQLTGAHPTPASDVYSLGVVGFELLLGSGALHGNALHEQFDRVRTGHLFTPQGAVGDLWSLLERMTQKDPASRYATAAAVLAGMDKPKGSLVAPEDVQSGRLWAALAGFVLLVGLAALGAGWFGTNAPPQEVAEVGTRPHPFSPLSAAVSDAGVPAPDLRRVVDQTHKAASADLGRSGCRGTSEPDEWPETIGLALPRAYDGRTAYPMIVLLHDDYVMPQVLLSTSHVQEFLDTEEVVIIAPASLMPQEIGPIDRYRDAWRDPEKAREVIAGAVDFAQDRLCVDEDRIFVVSHGMGFLGADAVKCEPWIRAIGAFGGAFRRNPRLAPKHCDGMTPMVWLHPMSSLLLPLRGGRACNRMNVEGVADTKDQFFELHKCEGQAAWQATGFGRCTTNACSPAFEFCEVRGGASWPGLSRNPAQILHSLRCETGRSSEADVLPVMWAYFQSLDAL